MAGLTMGNRVCIFRRSNLYGHHIAVLRMYDQPSVIKADLYRPALERIVGCKLSIRLWQKRKIKRIGYERLSQEDGDLWLEAGIPVAAQACQRLRDRMNGTRSSEK